MEWTVLSWNVLADAYLRPKWYSRSAPALLKAGARTAAIVEHLAASDADVMCLQEAEVPLVDAARHALPAYDVAYVAKRGGKPDGCAVLLRRSTITREDLHALAFADGAPDRANSGHIAMLLLARIGGRRVGIATTHLRWDPPGTAAASRWAVREVAQLTAAMHTEPRPEAWIVCGDLNIPPADPVYANLIGSGFIDPAAPDFAPTANPNGRARRIDHILHTAGVVGQCPPPHPLDDETPLPSDTMPSDHVPILARFRFEQSARRTM